MPHNPVASGQSHRGRVSSPRMAHVMLPTRIYENRCDAQINSQFTHILLYNMLLDNRCNYCFSGPVSPRCFHHHGGPEMAAFPPHLHFGIPLLLDALCHGVVALGVRSRWSGASRSQWARTCAVCHFHSLLYICFSVLHWSAGNWPYLEQCQLSLVHLNWG